MNNLSPYRYRNLHGKEVRLLKILTVDDKIVCSLVHHSLSNAPSFQALSYVWGTEPPSKSVECDEAKLMVTTHLLNGLQTLSRQFGAEWLWIDAICVNQEDDDEKEVQVPRMTEIYSSAARVVIWLGPACDNSDLVMEIIPELNSIFGSIEEIGTVTKATLVSYGLPAIEDPVWLGVIKLAFRDWFSRLWVVQEAVLARSIVILCGETQLEFAEMVIFIDFLRLSLLMDDIILEHNFCLPENDNGFSALPLIEQFRQMRSGGGDIHLYSLLQLSRRKLAGENVDKVYGMMGVMSAELRGKIKVDYSSAARRDFWQIYINISTISLEDHGFFVLSMAPSDEKHPELPSWCPDFRHDSETNSLHTTYCAGMADPDFDEVRIPKPIVRTPEPKNVEFRGLEMDKVKYVVELCPKAIHHVRYSSQKAQMVLEYEARCLELSKATIRTDDAIPNQHIGTLVTGMHPDRSFYYAAQAVEDYHCMRGTLQNVISQKGASGTMPQNQAAVISAERYLGAMSVAWRGSAFFSTEDGRIGIGPKSIKAGDSICIFFGAYVPHILRFDPTRMIHLFVGSAFVSGLMSGTEFYARDPCNTYNCFVVG